MALIGIDASRANGDSWSPGQRTGTEWYAYQLIQRMKAFRVPGLETRLYSRTFLKDGLEEFSEGWSGRILGWPFRRLWNQLRLSWELWRHPVDLFFQPVHTVPLWSGRRMVITLHDVGFERFPSLYPPKELRYHRLAARMAVRRANRILTVSEFSKRELMEIYKIPAERVTVTPLGVDTTRYRPDIGLDATAAALGKHRLSQPYFIYVGRIEEKKNIVNLLHAFAIFKSWRGVGDPLKLLMVGGFGHGKERILKEIRDRGLEPHVVMPGYVEEDDLPALMKAATALVFPSNYEGFGLPILQAQACGTPVITSDAASMPEVAGEGALYVRPGEPDDIAEKMKLLMDEGNVPERLRVLGFENVKRFSWDETARLTMNALLEVLGIQHQV